jgi:hypothetical protein
MSERMSPEGMRPRVELDVPNNRFVASAFT